MISQPVLDKLEYGRIIERLAVECRFSVSVELVQALQPATIETTVKRRLAETAEAVALLTDHPDVVLGGARDIRSALERAAKNGRLSPAEFLDIGDTLAGSRVLQRAIYQVARTELPLPILAGYADSLVNLPDLEQELHRSIGSAGEVLDTASPDLGRIRREVRMRHQRLIDRVNSYLGNRNFAQHLQENLITSRDGRYVLPVRADSRSEIPGVVHDVSSSGQTLFVEPLEVVDLNNRWREAQIEEEHEIERILDRLSAMIGDRSGQLQAMIDALAAIDFAEAKARLAFVYRATRPVISPITDDQLSRVNLKRARHPLLPAASVVPVDVEIGDQFRILLITGPNTGGKTVAMKTVGLLALMAQSGLFISADHDSMLSVFPAMFVDIGDEQSIQQSLSTFSLHIRNVIQTVEEVESSSLVLLDELGAGTDPQEGSALARAIIEVLLEKQALVMATTHYSEVKAFAYETAGVENASVEFDLETLSPTYRLTIGIPGQSNALAIAGRLGMPKSVLERAQSMVGSEGPRADRLIEEIMTKRDAAERSALKARELEREARSLRNRAEEERAEAERERHAARQEVLVEAEQELDSLRSAARRLERTGRGTLPSADEKDDLTADLDIAASQVRQLKERQRASAQGWTAPTINPGDRVNVLTLDLEGEVVAIDGEFAEVSLGGLRSRQRLIGLKKIGKREANRGPAVTVVTSPIRTVPLELDLRGERVASIEEILDDYLDNASRGGIPFVRIIHGKGSGALRAEVKRVLAGNAAVLRSRHAEPNQGGDGVTIAYFENV